MTFNLQKINELTSQWTRFAETHVNSNQLQSSSGHPLENFETPSEKFLHEIAELNAKTQSVIDYIQLTPPAGLQKQRESKFWHGALVSLSTESLRSIRLLEELSISDETEPLANQVLANCLGTATTTLALAKTFRFLISAAYEPEVLQMIAQVFGNHDMAPLHEVEKVPKTAVKKVLSELYGEEIVKSVFKLYKLNKVSDLTGDDLRALLIGVLANLNEDAIKHVVTHKERHKQITAFAFFDQFLMHPNSTVEKRYVELQQEELTGFLNCLRKSLLDLDVDHLCASKADYREQLLRDLNLLCFCNQVAINPNFPISLNSVLKKFPKEGQINDTLIPLSNQSLVPLSQILQQDLNNEAAPSLSSESTSFFPTETLSCFLNDAGLHRISSFAAAATPEPFEFLQTRHPLVIIAGMIEKMRSGKLSIVDAQKIKIELDAGSKSLLKAHEIALFENPAPFFHLYDLVQRMETGMLRPDHNAVLLAFQTLPDPLRHSIAGKIYQLSDSAAKNTIPNWGETHAADDLSLMLKVIINLKNNIFDFTYQKIKEHAASNLTSLSEEKRKGVHYEIYRLAKPLTDDPNWGENNALAKVSRLVAALHIRGVLPGPQLVRFQERITFVPNHPEPSLPTVISTDSDVSNSPSLPLAQTPILSELPKPDESRPKQNPLAELASMIENRRSGAFSLVEAQNVVIQLDPELVKLFAKHELALINDPSTFFHLSELVEQMASGAAREDKDAVMQAFQIISDPLRQSLASRIYQFSKDSTKGNVSNWGEVHAADDLECLQQAIDSLTNNIFDSIYSKITLFASSTLSSLQTQEQAQVHSEIYRTGNPTSDDLDWGEKNALAVTSRLIRALHFVQAMHTPEPVSNRGLRLEDPEHRHPPSVPSTPNREASHSRKPSERKLEAHGARLSPLSTPLQVLQSPSKSFSNVGSFEKSFAITSPFSPKKTGRADISSSAAITSPLSPKMSVVRVLFPPSSKEVVPPSAPSIFSSAPVPPLRAPLPPLTPLNPEQLHMKSELSRLKRECEARLKFSEMYKAAPLTSADLENISRLEGQISSCRTTIHLLQKQGAETEFSLSIVKALERSILENEEEIKKIRGSVPVVLEEFESFKNHINNFSSSELKLILHEIEFELGELDVFQEISSELSTFYSSFPNDELKKFAKENSELYKKLLVEGPGRCLSHLITTIKERAVKPELEPVHEIRPFRRRNRDTSANSPAVAKKQQSSPSIDMSEITGFRFKTRQRSGSLTETRQAPSISTPEFVRPPLRSRVPQSASRLSQESGTGTDQIEFNGPSKLKRREKLIEEARQAKFEQMKVDFTREKLLAFANECLKPDPVSAEQQKDLETQLLIIGTPAGNQPEREALTQQLEALKLKIRLKKEEEENAKHFIINANKWMPAISDPFVTTERLGRATEYAQKHVHNIQNRG